MTTYEISMKCACLIEGLEKNEDGDYIMTADTIEEVYQFVIDHLLDDMTEEKYSFGKTSLSAGETISYGDPETFSFTTYGVSFVLDDGFLGKIADISTPHVKEAQ